MIHTERNRPMTSEQYWATVWAAFVGAAFAALALVLMLWLATLVQNKLIGRRKGNRPPLPNAGAARDEHEESERPTMLTADEPIEEGRLRVAVRNSVSRAPDAVAARRRQEQLDAAAVRRGEETRPITVIRREMERVMLCEPPMVDGLTLFAYLRHHA